MKLQSSLKMTAAVAIALMAAPVYADPVDDQLVVNGELELATDVPAPAHLEGHLDTIYSGWRFRDDGTRQMQSDDFENPAMVLVDAGLEAWSTADGTEGKSCADCHNAIEDGMKGVRAVMPKVNAAGDIWSTENYINDCRTNRMGAEAWGYTDASMAAMVAAISMQSRGMPVNVAIDGDAAPFWEKGKEMYYTRTGLLELSCANCHEDNYGNMIRADHLSQGQINGFPVYRLKDTKLTTPQGRFKGCVRDTRAETYKPGSADFRALELYVASRGNGLPVEGVSVRN